MSVVFDSYLEVNKFNNAAEKCKTEADVKELCRKYLEGKGMYVADKKPEPPKIPDTYGNLARSSAAMTSTKSPPHTPDWAKDINSFEPSYDRAIRDHTLYATETYHLPYFYDYDPKSEMELENMLKGNISRMLGVELLKGDFIKFRVDNDLRLGSKVVEGKIRVLK